MCLDQNLIFVDREGGGGGGGGGVEWGSEI